MKRYIVGLAAVLAAIRTTVFSVSASAAPNADTILIGISAAKTGILAPYDLQAGPPFPPRIDQNKKARGVREGPAGGVHKGGGPLLHAPREAARRQRLR